MQETPAGSWMRPARNVSARCLKQQSQSGQDPGHGEVISAAHAPYPRPCERGPSNAAADCARCGAPNRDDGPHVAARHRKAHSGHGNGLQRVLGPRDGERCTPAPRRPLRPILPQREGNAGFPHSAGASGLLIAARLHKPFRVRPALGFAQHHPSSFGFPEVHPRSDARRRQR